MNIHKIFYLFLIFFLFWGCSAQYRVNSEKYTPYQGEVNQHARLIMAFPDKIFKAITSADELEKICPGGTLVSFETPPPYGPGTIVKTRIEHIFKLGWESRVEEVVQGKKIRLKFISGFFNGGVELWEFESRGLYTMTTHTIIVEPHGIIKKLAWNLKVRRKHNKMVEIFLDNLKSQVEASL